MNLPEQSITDGPLSAAQSPVLLDIEASSLASASYPIEVAWALSDGGIESHLISPASVPHWTDWNPQAERLHGIRRELLLAEGKSPAWVCTRMNEQLAGLTVFSDAPAYDEAWLQALFAATWKRPSFRLSPISFDDWLLEQLQRTLPHHAVKQRFAELRHQARHAIPLQHRAHGTSSTCANSGTESCKRLPEANREDHDGFLCSIQLSDYPHPRQPRPTGGRYFHRCPCRHVHGV